MMQSVDERVSEKERQCIHSTHEEKEEAVTTATILTQSKPERRLI